MLGGPALDPALGGLASVVGFFAGPAELVVVFVTCHDCACLSENWKPGSVPEEGPGSNALGETEGILYKDLTVVVGWRRVQ